MLVFFGGVYSYLLSISGYFRLYCQAQPKPQLQLSWGLSLHYSQCDPATRHPPATPAGIVDFLLAIAILVH